MTGYFDAIPRLAFDPDAEGPAFRQYDPDETVMGKRLEINPFIIFVAIIFWSWMWGAVGAMLALPLSLIVMTIINETLPDDRPMPQLPG